MSQMQLFVWEFKNSMRWYSPSETDAHMYYRYYTKTKKGKDQVKWLACKCNKELQSRSREVEIHLVTLQLHLCKTKLLSWIIAKFQVDGRGNDKNNIEGPSV